MSEARSTGVDIDSSEEDVADTRLLGVLPSTSDASETTPSRTRSIRTTTKSSGTTSRNRTASATSTRDRADDELNQMLNSNRAGLETKWIILIVSVILLLFTAMATAAFIVRRCHRGRILERKQQEEQWAREEEQNLAALTAETRQVEHEDPYNMGSRQPYAVV